jgi:predicted nuclease of predicted toxin-antitoxin system
VPAIRRAADRSRGIFTRGPVKILVDAQMPPAVAVWLQAQGHDAQAVRDVGLREATDSAIWAHALQNGAVILTKDEDFAARVQQVPDGPVIVWLRVGNCSNAALRAWLEPRLSGIVQLVDQGSRLVEVI